MKIFPIISNQLYRNQNVYQNSNNAQISDIAPKSIKFNTISFTAISGSAALKSLAKYGIPDMYTGNLMLSSEMLSKMQNTGVFELPLKKLIPILKKYEKTMLNTYHEVFLILENMSKNNPDITIEAAFEQQFPKQQELLLNKQFPVFEKLTEKSCDLPKDIFEDFMNLMQMTEKRIAKDPYIFHFSEKEFIYKLQQLAKQIKTKNNKKEINDINTIIREAKRMFLIQAEEKKKFGRGFNTRLVKMEYQMLPQIKKQNIKNIQELRKILDSSSLRNNRELKNLFRNTSAKICGFPVIEPFKRKEFIYDLKNVLKFMKDKRLHAEMIKIVHELPTSREDVSAFFVKHVHDSPTQIGYYLFKDSLASTDHIVAKKRKIKPEEQEEIEKLKNKNRKKKAKNKKGGKSHISNYGLSAAGINFVKSNEPFDDFVRKHPECYKTIPIYINRMIDLYLDGSFEKVGLNKSYIVYFKKTIEENSPKEKPIILDISRSGLT